MVAITECYNFEERVWSMIAYETRCREVKLKAERELLLGTVKGIVRAWYSNGVDSSSIKDYILKTYPNFDSKLLGNIISKVYGLQQV